MAQTSLWALQVALYERLSSDAKLNEVITGVYDEVKKDAVFPYVTYDSPNVNPFDTKTSTGENITFVIHCWSRYSGNKEAMEILNLILQAISTPLELSGGFSMQKQGREQIQVITDADGTTRHGILRVRFYVNN